MRGVAAFVMIIIGMLTLSSTGIPLPASAKSTAEPQWAMYRGDSRNTGLSPYDASDNPGELAWSYTEHFDPISSPVIGKDGTIYIADRSMEFFAINKDGTKKWKRNLDGDWFAKAPAIDSNGDIYFATWGRGDPGNLYAYNSNGVLKWNLTFEENFRAPPVIDDNDIIYLANGDQYLYAFYPNGTIKWKFRCWTLFITTPAIASDGSIFYNKWVINPDGTERYQFEDRTALSTSPAIGSDGTIYYGCRDNGFYAVNETGSVKWKYQLRSKIQSSPAIGPDGMIYFGCDDSYLYAMSPDGDYSWSYKITSPMYTPPVVSADGIIFITSSSGYLYALNPDGSLRWKIEEFHSISNSPAIGSDGTVYVTSNAALIAIGKPGPWELSLDIIILTMIVILPIAATVVVLHHERGIYKRLGLTNYFKKQSKR
jgi:outer membrane protein assembly factor BamB